MASAQPEQSRVLQDELTCTVCLDLYRDPHLLPCGHSFCKTCLDRLKRQANRGRLHCPECRDSHRCDTAFQKNFKLANIADDYRHRRRATTAAASALRSRELLSSSLAALSAVGVSAVPCDYCPAAATETPGVSTAEDGASAASDSQEASAAAAVAPTLAVRTCLKCEVSMCQEHVIPHLELPAFREHPLIEPLNDFWKRKCPTHDEIFRYYCMDDKMFVCNACTFEGQHDGHAVKTLSNTMKDLKASLDEQLYKLERKYSLVEKKLQEQKEKERQNKKFMDDSEQCLTRLGEDIKTKVLLFITRLRDFPRIRQDVNNLTIQKNISRICQDQVRLQEARCGLETLMQENDPFRFIEAYKTTGKQCCRQLRKTMFYPEYVDMEMEALAVMMEEEMRKFLDEELPCHIDAAISSLCHVSDPEEEEEQDDNEAEEEEEEDDDDDDDDDSSEEDMRSNGDEEEDHEDLHDQNELVDDLYSPGEEEEEE
ncbi:E3 ubiquitin-protein ligase TRIM11-like, partial [Salarias fasciatus]|uniref:E3 ubiquitin-protein ligase TRIM11-like n=1 Tax=Salarias fasciatus TaxID=181472 RepID=UPI001176C697